MAIRLSLIIPTYNEKDNIISLLDEITETLGPDEAFEIIVVDDDSPDLTWNIVEEYALRNKRVKIIRRKDVKGLSGAVIAGFIHAQGEFLGVMDADLSHDCRILPRMIAAVGEEGFDLAVGSRRIPGGGADKWPWYRKVFSNIATAAAKQVLNDMTLNDPMSGYFVIKRELFENIKDKINPRGYKILLEICSVAKPRKIKEIPFIFKDRRQGYSKLTLKVVFEYVQMLYQLRRKRKTRIENR